MKRSRRGVSLFRALLLLGCGLLADAHEVVLVRILCFERVPAGEIRLCLWMDPHCLHPDVSEADARFRPGLLHEAEAPGNPQWSSGSRHLDVPLPGDVFSRILSGRDNRDPRSAVWSLPAWAPAGPVSAAPAALPEPQGGAPPPVPLYLRPALLIC